MRVNNVLGTCLVLQHKLWSLRFFQASWGQDSGHSLT